MSRLSLEDITKIAEEKELEILDANNYINMDSDLHFKCKQNHNFVSTIKTIRNKSFSCPLCDSQTVNYAYKPPKKSGYRVMGFDQATQHFGISVYDDGLLVYYDCINFTGEVEERLAKIYNFLELVIQNWEPDYVMIEDIQLQGSDNYNGYTTFKTLAELLGIVKMILTKYKIPHSCVLNKIWQAEFLIGGKTRIEQKNNVIKKVKNLFGVDVNDDIADAILIGKYAVKKTTKPKQTTKLF